MNFLFISVYCFYSCVVFHSFSLQHLPWTPEAPLRWSPLWTSFLEWCWQPSKPILYLYKHTRIHFCILICTAICWLFYKKHCLVCFTRKYYFSLIQCVTMCHYLLNSQAFLTENGFTPAFFQCTVFKVYQTVNAFGHHSYVEQAKNCICSHFTRSFKLFKIPSYFLNWCKMQYYI